METFTSTLTVIQVSLSGDERWQDWNADGRPFSVRWVRYGGGSRATLQGPAIKTDGSEGLIDRSRTVSMKDLPWNISHEINVSYYETLKKALREHAERE